MELKKNPKADLEKRKGLYFEIGLVVILAVCLCAFSIKSYDKDESTGASQAQAEEMEEMDEIENTDVEETPPPPPPPAVQEVEVLNVVEDNVETETIEVTTEETEQEVVIAAPVEAPVEEEEEEVVFVVVESMPEFPGGQQALFKYLSENVKYPVIAQENGIQGRVICQFVVNKDGSIVDVEVVRSGGDPSLDKEAIRVIKSMPNWKPGKQRGKAVRVKYTVPVNFKLQ